MRVISKRNKLDFKFVYDLRKILLNEGVDLINPHHYGPIAYSFLATRFTGIRFVYTEHSRWSSNNWAI